MRLPRVSSYLRALLLVAALTACGGGGGNNNPDGGGGDPDADVNTPDGGGGDPDAAPPVCGDGDLGAGEDCDDGDLDGGDGCSDACEAEDGFACPTPGQPCVDIVVCGNDRIEGDETCDDGDTEPDDGCSATCQREPGWSCPVAGTACVAAECGDGIVAGFEECDDGSHGAGCVDCQLEEGYHCPVEGAACAATDCGDGNPQGLEECDDGNAIVGDGCTPGCVAEPVCADGVCQRKCGDAVLQVGEQCDDGNSFSGDGCSDQCQEETGFACDEVPLADPAEVRIFATVRDFIASCGTGSRLVEGASGATAPYGHPDFECYNGARDGMVAAELDVDGKPVRVSNDKTFSDESFAQWYRSDPELNQTLALEMVLPAIGGGAYRFDSASFFPATGLGWDVTACGNGMCERLHDDSGPGGDVNFHFTSEVHFWFEYNGTENLAFSGDDDVWVFINGRLAVDIGGVHGRLDDDVDLSDPAVADALDLTLGGVYEAIVFQAERHTSRSQYRLTLTNFNQTPSTCDDDCGDGTASSQEQCDLGDSNGDGDGSVYGGCDDECRFEPYCGDAIVQAEHGEVCDDGLNLGGNASACAPGCTSMGASCGDGVVQTDAGEQCDDGGTANGDGCSDECQFEVD